MELSPPALLIALGAALGFGLLDAVRKRLTTLVAPMPLAALLALGQAPVFLGWSLVAGSRDLGPGYAPALAGSVACGVLGNVLFLRALQLSPFSIVLPLLSFSPVFAALLSFVLLGEQPSARQVAGILGVVAGAVLLNLSASAPGEPEPLWRRLLRERGSLFMLGAALAWTTGSIFDKQALAAAPLPVHGLLQAGGVALALGVVLGVRGQLGSLGAVRHGWRIYVATVAVAALTQALQFMALQRMLVSLYEALKRCNGLVLAVLVGALFFSEPVTRRKVGAVALVGAGVVLLLV
jgi:drug/metabolite transporter (DMT)-like permease